MVTPDSLSPYDMNAANYGYTRHLLSVASMGDCADGLAAVLPCPCGYTEFAKSMICDVPDDPIYAEWISFFGEGEDDGILDDMKGLLDRNGRRRRRRTNAPIGLDIPSVYQPLRGDVLGRSIQHGKR